MASHLGKPADTSVSLKWEVWDNPEIHRQLTREELDSFECDIGQVGSVLAVQLEFSRAKTYSLVYRGLNTRRASSSDVHPVQLFLDDWRSFCSSSSDSEIRKLSMKIQLFSNCLFCTDCILVLLPGSKSKAGFPISPCTDVRLFFTPKGTCTEDLYDKESNFLLAILEKLAIKVTEVDGSTRNWKNELEMFQDPSLSMASYPGKPGDISISPTPTEPACKESLCMNDGEEILDLDLPQDEPPLADEERPEKAVGADGENQDYAAAAITAKGGKEVSSRTDGSEKPVKASSADDLSAVRDSFGSDPTAQSSLTMASHLGKPADTSVSLKSEVWDNPCVETEDPVYVWEGIPVRTYSKEIDKLMGTICSVKDIYFCGVGEGRLVAYCPTSAFAASFAELAYVHKYTGLHLCLKGKDPKEDREEKRVEGDSTEFDKEMIYAVKDISFCDLEEGRLVAYCAPLAFSASVDQLVEVHMSSGLNLCLKGEYPCKEWNGECVGIYSKAMDELLGKIDDIQGVCEYGVDADHFVVAHCPLTAFRAIEQQFTKLHESTPSRLCLIVEDSVVKFCCGSLEELKSTTRNPRIL